MVDSIGPKATAPRDRRIAPLSGTAAAKPVASVADKAASEPAAAASSATSLASGMASSPPVDAGRVARIRNAIADGSYSIDPGAIAGRMLALKADWTSHDQA